MFAILSVKGVRSVARVIIACSTLKRELNQLMEKLHCTDRVIWLEAGEHNLPQKRREALESAISSCGERDTVLLAMSLCGSTLIGLESGTRTFLVPCFDDCIGLFLKDPRKADTYYLTEGWLEGKHNILEEYRISLEKYGQVRTKRIFDAMLRGYRTIAWVETGCASPEGKKRAKEAAALLGLEFAVVSGTLSRLEDLLLERDTPHILRIPPNSRVSQRMRCGMVPVRVIPDKKILYALPGEQLLVFLRRQGLAPDAPCGGQGTCGKCTVLIDGIRRKACCVVIHGPLTVTISPNQDLQSLPEQAEKKQGASQPVAAVDIGTTSLVCSLLDGESGVRVAVKSASNPQSVYGADVVSRIRAALDGHLEELTRVIRREVARLLLECCAEANVPPVSLERLCLVGNPAMEQLFLGISPENLIKIPFSPLLTGAEMLFTHNYLPEFPNAKLLVVPNISAYVGGDTVGCILAEKLKEKGELTLLVDIGTNGEMVLATGNRMVACATAAGPALEGANILFGMGARAGAIDHVWLENQQIRFSTIQNSPAAGICGSGLIDAVSVFLELGKLNARGRIAPDCTENGQRILPLCDGIYLTQEDIRHVQLAKGAIQAGIHLMLKQIGASVEDISCCFLAGAFGTFLNPDNACRIGLLPPELGGKIRSVGNAALRGAEMMALNEAVFLRSQLISAETEVLELASHPDFPIIYGKCTYF